jgi:hypothetical protein
MKRDLKNEILKVMKFLGKNFTDEQIDQLCVHLDFNSMKKNPSVNLEENLAQTRKSFDDKIDDEDYCFIRKGQIGSYKEEMSAELNAKFDEYANHPDFEEHGFAYKF